MENSAVKVVIVGDSRCGKSCFAESFCAKGRWTEPTYWFGSFSQMPQPHRLIDGNRDVVLWEPPCGTEYERLRPLSYPQANLFVLCFHARDEKSLQRIEKFWAPEVRHYEHHVPIILLGLRTDCFPANALAVLISECIGIRRERNGSPS